MLTYLRATHAQRYAHHEAPFVLPICTDGAQPLIGGLASASKFDSLKAKYLIYMR